MASNQHDRNQPSLGNEALWKRLEALETELKSYKDEVSFLRGQLSATENIHFKVGEAHTSRRHMLKKLAAGVAGVGALSLAASSITANKARAETASDNAIEATPGPYGYAGKFMAGGQANVFLQPASTQLVINGLMSDGKSHIAGELVADSDGSLWYCVTSGTPGKWRSLATATSLGSAGALANPDRFVDTRTLFNSFGILQQGTPQTIQITSTVGQNGVTVPTGTTAVGGIATVVSPNQGGFLVVYPADAASIPGTSNVNFSGGQIIANSFFCRLSSDGKLKIAAGGLAGLQVNVLIDINTYYI